jgi:serine/threonine protein kinase/predicted hydrocarbon binding protein
LSSSQAAPAVAVAAHLQPVSADTASPSPWRPGAEFSKYEIDSRLAAGGMAEVWRAKIKGAQGFEKRIVVKTMLTALQSRPDVVQMFISEAAIAAQLGHSNIVHVFDFGQLEGRYFIAMEYVPGVTLRIAHKRMRARGMRLPITTLLHVMADVCDALEHVHEAADARGPLGLVHRDISPDTIIISTSGSAKLIDFGAARATARTPPTPVFVGKYRYSAPERIRRVGEDRRSDIWSVGVILFECLTGKRPFDGTDQEVAEAACASPGCDPRGLAPSVPAPVAELVLKATSLDPDDRFATAREMRLALIACLPALGGGGKERDVTAALAELLDAPQAPERTLSFVSPSEAEIALCEVEILDASGPIRNLAQPPPLPTRPVASAIPKPPPIKAPPPHPAAVSGPPPVSIFSAPSAPSGAAVHGWRTTSSHPRSPEQERSARERAVEMFDRGLELRGAGRYGEALDAWERALALAPDNRIYQSNVQRLRNELDRLRTKAPPIDVLSALRVSRPTLGPEAGVGLYRLLRMAAFDASAGDEAVAAATAAGEKVGRSLGMVKLDELVALLGSMKLGIVEAAAVTESTVRVVVRECAACAGALPSGKAVCHFEAGRVSGAVASIFERPVRVRETACIGGCGDDACRFEIDFG